MFPSKYKYIAQVENLDNLQPKNNLISEAQKAAYNYLKESNKVPSIRNRKYGGYYGS